MLGMLEFPASVTVEESREWVRALILALGRPRRHTEIGYVIKFTSFHLFHLPLIRTAFPGTPWMFVFRDPISVMRSVLGSPTGFMRMQATPSEAARYLGLPPAAIAALPREEYLARFLARMLRFVLTHCSEAEIDRVRFVNYEWLPEAIWNEVSPFLGVSLSMKEKAAMRQLSLAYSKDPTGGRRFQPTAVEDSDVSDKLQRVADRWLTEPFQEVQAIAWKLRGAGPDGAARWVREPES
jgi:hypothetical protein